LAGKVWTRLLVVFISTALLVTVPFVAHAEEEKEKTKDEDVLEDELSLQEDDYPDLIGVDEESEIMDEFALLQEQDIVFTAAKHKQKAGFSPASVIVITRRDIVESGASNLTELLRRYPGMHVYITNPLYPALMIRGTIRVMVTVDGREVNVELYTAPFYELLPVGMEDIERIEVVLGPNSALYGANAVSAVINIQTIKPETGFHTHMSVAAGENGTTRVGGRLEGGSGPLALQGTVRVERASSWMDRRSVVEKMLRSNLTAELDLDGTVFTARGGVVYGTGNFYGMMGDMDFRKMLLADAQLEFTTGDLKTLVYWYGLRGTFDIGLDLYHPDTGADLGDTPVFDFDMDTIHTEAQYDISLFTDNLLIAGADFRLTTMHCANIVQPDATEIRFGVFIHDEQRFLDKLLLTVGARFDWNSQTRPAVSPRAALVYNPEGEHFLRVSGAMAFRKPSLMETSTNFKITTNFPEIKVLFEDKGISNPDLRNEILTGFEIGYRGAMLEKALRLGVDVYFNLNRDWISFASNFAFDGFGRIDLENTSIGYINSDLDFNIIGVSFFVEGDPVDELTLFLRGEYRYEWYINTGEIAKKTPPYLGSAGGTLRLPFGLTVHLALVHVSKREDDVSHPLSALESYIWKKMPALTYLLAGITYRLDLGHSHVDLGLSLFNPYGGFLKEKAGMPAPDGSNHGGEIVGSRALLTARFHY
jgi:outer membrane receptor protein involved in Fe transport